jgi:pimeloyl-ACP methyl ester carboxylesterase
LGTKFIWTPESADKEASMLDPRAITNKVPAYAAHLAEKHKTVSWQILLGQTAELMRSLGGRPALDTADYAQIRTRVMVARGELDKMVSQEEADFVFKHLLSGTQEVLPATPHPLAQTDPALLCKSLVRFFKNETTVEK